MPTRACVGRFNTAITAAFNRDIRNLKAALKSVNVEEAFLPVVAPASAAYDGVNEYYPTKKNTCTPSPMRCARSTARFTNPGCSFRWTTPCWPTCTTIYVQQSPEKYRQWAGLRIEALNHALQGIPEDRVRYHVCFGSWHVPHLADAPLEEIVGFILSVRAGAYSIEAANPRHEHEWRVWEANKLPGGKNSDSRRCDAPHDYGRASAPGGRPHRALRADRGTRERDRRDGLRLRAGANRPARAAVGDVGEIRGAGRGRASRQRGALALGDISKSTRR